MQKSFLGADNWALHLFDKVVDTAGANAADIITAVKGPAPIQAPASNMIPIILIGGAALVLVLVMSNRG